MTITKEFTQALHHPHWILICAKQSPRGSLEMSERQFPPCPATRGARVSCVLHMGLP